MPIDSRVVPSRDLLRMPVLGPFLRWRHARTTLQAVCLGLAVVLILDGLFGPQIAPRNLAGTLPWVHWRGFVVLALLVMGNLFCMACPFMLPRRLAKRLFPVGRSWPRVLGSKWIAVGLLLVFFWAYEAFQLWASPWWTAWVAIGYFVLAFAVDSFFRGAAFCKHICPIGQFHFVNGMVSPTEVRVRDSAVCRECSTKDCIRGRYSSPIPSAGADRALATMRTRAASRAPGQARGREGLLQRGCELSLFQPRKVGNLDCTFCLECIHACPHDNVGILVRSPVRELSLDSPRSGVGRLSRRPDTATLAALLVFGAFFNAFGMIGPGAEVRESLTGGLSGVVGAAAGPIATGMVLGMGLVLLPAALLVVVAASSALLAAPGGSLLQRASTYVWGLVPLGFGMWLAHYLFHLLTGGLTIVPVVQEYLADLGLRSPGATPHWGLGPMVPEGWILPIQLVLLQGGLLLTLVAGSRIARREEDSRGRAFRAFLPWAVLAFLLTLAGSWLLAQPMEMRGTFLAL